MSLDNAATVATDEQKAKPHSARDENVWVGIEFPIIFIVMPSQIA